MPAQQQCSCLLPQHSPCNGVFVPQLPLRPDWSKCFSCNETDHQAKELSLPTLALLFGELLSRQMMKRFFWKASGGVPERFARLRWKCSHGFWTVGTFIMSSLYHLFPVEWGHCATVTEQRLGRAVGLFSSSGNLGPIPCVRPGGIICLCWEWRLETKETNQELTGRPAKAVVMWAGEGEMPHAEVNVLFLQFQLLSLPCWFFGGFRTNSQHAQHIPVQSPQVFSVAKNRRAAATCCNTNQPSSWGDSYAPPPGTRSYILLNIA